MALFACFPSSDRPSRAVVHVYRTKSASGDTWDKVESKNLLAQAFTKHALGRNKADAMRLQLLNFYGVRATAFPVRIEATNVESLGEPAGLLVDCLDNLAGRRVLSTYARASSKPLVHAALSADGQFGLIRLG
jgi:molybdopterin/thiamine biosynthesis adenylyltransferase